MNAVYRERFIGSARGAGQPPQDASKRCPEDARQVLLPAVQADSSPIFHHPCRQATPSVLALALGGGMMNYIY
jgi:hypothetical protein